MMDTCLWSLLSLGKYLNLDEKEKLRIQRGERGIHGIF